MLYSYSVSYIFGELFQGFLVSILVFFLTLVFALPLGFLICLCTMSKWKPLSYLSKGLTWIIRGTPLMLQVIVLFYVPSLMNWTLKASFFQQKIFFFLDDPSAATRIFYVIIAFIINYAFYFSEIYRGGILSVRLGQYEASKVLGMSKGETFRHVILPQTLKRVFPSLSNEMLTLVKDTSLARVIGVVEIIRAAQDITAQTSLIWPLFSVMLFYLAFNGLLTLLFGKIEKKITFKEA